MHRKMAQTVTVLWSSYDSWFQVSIKSNVRSHSNSSDITRSSLQQTFAEQLAKRRSSLACPCITRAWLDSLCIFHWKRSVLPARNSAKRNASFIKGSQENSVRSAVLLNLISEHELLVLSLDKFHRYIGPWFLCTCLLVCSQITLILKSILKLASIG